MFPDWRTDNQMKGVFTQGNAIKQKQKHYSHKYKKGCVFKTMSSIKSKTENVWLRFHLDKLQKQAELNYIG